ncbi:binding-protein-dependent transport systems inner membrane component [Alkaliphilus metalliredigens QYMF]|uniref:Nickel import system permease protein NikB n=1 Tax=Alkaliphilus metalliredigens (strain QYMF) TaxID=293826 RepID=A6TPT9_ALKMQ|nr:nickel ABC transporter permease [Alkaliphilus metalliredigens]ABR48207.1 binding-protein-dependent transport systems inner membrane component [Alkaliphilus metalliredigens QYMF]
MTKYIINRLLQLIPILLGLSILTFSLLSIAPGDPVQQRLTSNGVVVSQELLDQQRSEMGLDRPLWEQYRNWLLKLLRGDMGVSYKDDIAVTKKLGDAFKYTLVLSSVSIGVSIIIAFPIGIYTAIRQDSIMDYIIRFFSFVGNSVPNFLVCILLMYFFCIRNKWFPIIAQNNIQGLFLPTLSLAIPICSRLIRQVRAEMLDQLKKGYICAARIRGVKERYILFFNALRNALPGIITVIGLAIGALLGGSVVIENIFRWPGIGKLVMDAIINRDYPVIQGSVLLTAVIYVVTNLVIDISYKYLDPRIEG